jgi:hypothetical protein
MFRCLTRAAKPSLCLKSIQTPQYIKTITTRTISSKNQHFPNKNHQFHPQKIQKYPKPPSFSTIITPTHSTLPNSTPLYTTPLLFSFFPAQQAQKTNPKLLSREMDIDYYANEEHYKEEIEYVNTPDIVVNIRQIQRIIMKDAFLCKKYCRYIIETIEDAKLVIQQAEKRLGSMIDVTTHEPTNEVYKSYLLKLDQERDALDGYTNLALLCVMPVASITKHFKAILDEQHNDGGLKAEFNLAQEQFDIIHEQLNQLQELSGRCDGLVEVSEECVHGFLRDMAQDIEAIQDNQLPSKLAWYNTPRLSSIYIDENGNSTNKYVSPAEIETVFQEINDPREREDELKRIAARNRMKAHKPAAKAGNQKLKLKD